MTPIRVIEGMIINAYAIGARYGYIYVRPNIRLPSKISAKPSNRREELGLLGKNILGSGLDFRPGDQGGRRSVRLRRINGLVASIEGERGMPRPRPPRLSEASGGLWGKPTNLNNVETFATCPTIITKGVD